MTREDILTKLRMTREDILTKLKTTIGEILYEQNFNDAEKIHAIKSMIVVADGLIEMLDEVEE